MKTLKVRDYNIVIITQAELEDSHIERELNEYGELGFKGYMPLLPLPANDPNQLYTRSVASDWEDVRKIQTVAGHDPFQIDSAVPQSWWDQEYKRTGIIPRACWTYEQNKLFGEPLKWDTIFRQYREAIVKELFNLLSSQFVKEKVDAGHEVAE